MDEHLVMTLARGSGLLAMGIILFQLLSMGKGRTLDKLVNKSWLVKIHRKAVWPLLVLILFHALLVVYGRSLEYEDSIRETLSDFFLDGRGGSLTGGGLAILFFALTMSILFLLKKIAYPTFKQTHYLMYAAAPMLFIHQIFFGLHFVSNTILWTAWTTLAVLVAADLLVWKARLLFLQK